MGSQKLRELFNSPGLIRIVGANNALGAKLVEQASFEGVWASGFEISASHAVPDASILTMSEFLAAASSMANTVEIPIVADVDTGFGTSSNVMQMVRKYEAAGIAAVCMEDKKHPKVNSFIPGRQDLAPIAEFVGKIMAAKNAQRTKEFMVFARVEALIAGWGHEEALKRAYAYAEAGADAILIHSKSKSPKEILDFINDWDGRLPLVLVPTTYNSLTEEEIQKTGKVKLIIYANHCLRASISSMRKVLDTIQKDKTTKNLDWIAPMKEVFDLQGMPRLKELEKIYLRGSEENVKALILAAGDHSNEETLRDISKEIPICMLDINGKPLLQRQIEALNQSGIYDINTVVGYKKEKVNVGGTNLLPGSSKGIMSSLMVARNKLDEKTLVAFSDILFDSDTVKRLSESAEDITLLVSKYDPAKKANDQVTDFIVADKPPVNTRRKLHYESGIVLDVGTKIDPSKAHYEFSGLMLLSKKGAKLLTEVYDKAKERYNDSRFNESENFEAANLNSVLQELIKEGHKISFVETDSGWLEVHSFDNYKEACSLVR